eukprot:TRINITY_DN22245_c1_g1_i1.p1 TRINITY_DN22245_c1_g1~~TRINITY_DN22245_c1_g1_i1.p1  ORF type:complete len:810 (-),score=234.74 TRINITY_DN22245_c1_g1_i1:282-2711(-)
MAAPAGGGYGAPGADAAPEPEPEAAWLKEFKALGSEQQRKKLDGMSPEDLKVAVLSLLDALGGNEGSPKDGVPPSPSQEEAEASAGAAAPQLLPDLSHVKSEPEGGAIGLLQSAARSGSTDEIEKAVSAGATLNDQDQWGLSPLHSAAQEGHVEAAACLLKHRALIDERSSRGLTALHLATSYGKVDVVSLLISSRADVLLKTGHGSSTLELTDQFGPAAACEPLIRDEIERRWLTEDETARDLKTRLTSAEDTRALAEEQLGGLPRPPADAAPRRHAITGMDGPKGLKKSDIGSDEEDQSVLTSPTKASKKAGKIVKVAGYWEKYESLVLRAQENAKEAFLWIACRPVPKESALLQIPWKGGWMTTGKHNLPILDPDDEDLAVGHERLRLAAAERKARIAAKKISYETVDPEVQQAKDAEMIKRTGKTQAEWERLVSELKKEKSRWEWDRVEIRERKVDGRPKDAGMLGVFAVKPGYKPPKAKDRRKKEEDDADQEHAPPKSDAEEEDPQIKIVYRKHEVIGPLVGVLRRKARHEEVYYPQKKYALYDPFSYALQSRIQTVELKPEPLMLDLSAAGEVQNRLRYLADARSDPLRIFQLLPGMSFEDPIEKLLPPRPSMPRPRSRPSSPVSSPDSRPTTQESVKKRKSKCDKQDDDADAAGGPDGTKDASLDFVLQEGCDAIVNTRIVEVLVDGWPYVFAVATRDISHGQELACDFGRPLWDHQMTLMHQANKIDLLSNDILQGAHDAKNKEEVDKLEKVVDFSLPARKPMMRIEMLKQPVVPEPVVEEAPPKGAKGKKAGAASPRPPV